MDDRIDLGEPGEEYDAPRPPAAFPLPEAAIAGDPSFLAALVAAIIGVLFFWRKKKPEDEET